MKLLLFQIDTFTFPANSYRLKVTLLWRWKKVPRCIVGRVWTNLSFHNKMRAAISCCPLSSLE